MSAKMKTRRQPISWGVSPNDAVLIKRIVARAVTVARQLGFDPIDEQSLEMDLTATHANGTPLRLSGLSEAVRPDFVHDVWGIKNHIDRRTGRLLGHFHPRYARAEVA